MYKVTFKILYQILCTHSNTVFLIQLPLTQPSNNNIKSYNFNEETTGSVAPANHHATRGVVVVVFFLTDEAFRGLITPLPAKTRTSSRLALALDVHVIIPITRDDSSSFPSRVYNRRSRAGLPSILSLVSSSARGT